MRKRDKPAHEITALQAAAIAAMQGQMANPKDEGRHWTDLARNAVTAANALFDRIEESDAPETTPYASLDAYADLNRLVVLLEGGYVPQALRIAREAREKASPF